MSVKAIPVDQRLIDIDSRRFSSIEKALIELLPDRTSGLYRSTSMAKGRTKQLSKSTRKKNAKAIALAHACRSRRQALVKLSCQWFAKASLRNEAPPFRAALRKPHLITQPLFAFALDGVQHIAIGIHRFQLHIKAP